MKNRRKLLQSLAAIPLLSPLVFLQKKKPKHFLVWNKNDDVVNHIDWQLKNPDKSLYDIVPRKKDLYMSKDALDDIKNWSVDELDEKTMQEIYASFGKYWINEYK